MRSELTSPYTIWLCYQPKWQVCEPKRGFPAVGLHDSMQTLEIVSWICDVAWMNLSHAGSNLPWMTGWQHVFDYFNRQDMIGKKRMWWESISFCRVYRSTTSKERCVAVSRCSWRDAMWCIFPAAATCVYSRLRVSVIEYLRPYSVGNSRRRACELSHLKNWCSWLMMSCVHTSGWLAFFKIFFNTPVEFFSTELLIGTSLQLKCCHARA